MSGPAFPSNRPPPLRLPGGWLIGLIPLIWLAGLGIWIVVRWSHLPPMIPIHWNFRMGVPDFWVRRTVRAMLSVMGTMSAICLAFIALAWLMLQQPPQISQGWIAAERTFRRHTALLIVASAWFVAFWPAFTVLPLSVDAFRAWMVLFAATLLTGVVALLRSGIRMYRDQHGVQARGAHTPGADEGRWYGPFYVNRRNRALLVSKRFGAGYTFNFANPWAWVLLVALLGAAVIFTRFLRR